MNIKEYEVHADVPSKEKWDLSFLLEGKTPEQAIEEALAAKKELVKIKDSKYDSAKAFLTSIKSEEEMVEKYFKIENYLSNSNSLNVVDPETARLSQKFQFEDYKLDVEIGPEEPKLFKNAEKVMKWIEQPEFAEYKFYISDVLRGKKHVLSDDVEEFDQKSSRGKANMMELFGILTNSELDKGFAESSDGEKIPVSNANLRMLSQHDDAMVRRTASQAYSKAYLRHKESLASMLYQHKKSEATRASVRNFPSTVDMLTFSDDSPKKMLLELFKAVQENVPSYKTYVKEWKGLYKKRFGEEPTKYDMNRELIKVSSEVTIEDGMRDVIASVKPFGDEYVSIVEKGLKENWVDFHPVKNKRSGAYSIGGSFGIEKKLILMNWDGTFNSVNTLAHEFGHSMHSYYSDKSNSLFNSMYRLFVAEVASIFNELMLLDHWLETSKNDDFKFYMLEQSISGFIGTVFRQTEWSNYEYDLYEALDKGQPIGSFQAMSKIYYDNMLKYTAKDKVEHTDEETYSAIRVPHFYLGFYVHKYAIGQLVANVFFQKYKEEGKSALTNYINNFLSIGNSKSPLQTLKDAGVDLLDPKTYETGFKAFKSNIDQWTKLSKQVIKGKDK